MKDDIDLERLQFEKMLLEKHGISPDQIIHTEDVIASGKEYKIFDGPEAVKQHNELREFCEKEFGPQEYR